MKKQLLFLVGASTFLFFCCCHSPEEKAVQKADSLQYQYQTKVLSYQNCNPDSNFCTYFRFEYPLFSNAPKALMDSIETIQKGLFTGNEEGTYISADSSFREMLKEYSEYRKAFPTSDVSWNWDVALKIMKQTKEWVQLEVSSYGYTGGAHDFGGMDYYTLEKSTGRRMSLSDFIDSSKMEKLRQLGEVEFCKVRNIPPEQSLSDAGFTFEGDQFFLPRNFYFDEAGLHFLFNSYEVGPYVLRETEFFIPANKVVPLMKQPAKGK